MNNTIDDIRLKSSLTTNKTIKFTKNSFFYTILGFTKSHSGVLGVIPGFVQLNLESYRSNRPINIKEIDNIHLKYDCIHRSIVNGVRETIFYSFDFRFPLGHKIYKEPRIKLLKRINKCVLSHITFYLEDDDHKSVDFNG